jgi:inosine-uridine nucleoside N-ribohydrolase
LKPKMIIDCDPGDDDAVAILLAGRHADLVGITTVSGNVPLADTTRNALVVTQVLGLDVPVHAGASRPLVAEPAPAHDVHGKTGLDGPALPPLGRKAAGTDASGFIIEAATRHDALWLVATGPLTNVALALRRDPEAMARLKGISLMGGSAGFGNRTAVAEFNILQDPEAADIVFRSGLPIRMAGLNLTHQIKATDADRAAIRSVGGAAAAFFADLLDFSAQTYASVYFGRRERPLHDPCAVLAVTHPELFRHAPRHVAVELRGEHTRGMTVVDERDLARPAAATAEVGYNVDADAMRRLLVETVAAYDAPG